MCVHDKHSQGDLFLGIYFLYETILWLGVAICSAELLNGSSGALSGYYGEI